MRPVLLLDFDHTLYPPSLPTLKALDDRITRYIEAHLGLPRHEADAVRLRFCEEYGTTLRGLEALHGVDRDHYCDYITAVEDELLPPPDPRLHDWLARIPHPCYIFTNARADWAVRGLRAMGLAGLLPEGLEAGIRDAAAEGATMEYSGPRLLGILDIHFMDWQGKPHADAFAKADCHLRAIHGGDIRIHFADDRPDNLMAAREAGWSTIWVTPARPGATPWGSDFDQVVASLTELDPGTLSPP